MNNQTYGSVCALSTSVFKQKQGLPGCFLYRVDYGAIIQHLIGEIKEAKYLFLDSIK